MTYTIGFANLHEASPYAVAVRESLQQALAPYDDIELICRDNALDDERALANIEAFVARDVDMAIIYHVNQRIGFKFRNLLAGKPIITIDIPIQFTHHFSLNNVQAGRALGQAFAHWIRDQWQGRVDKILALVDSRVLDSRARVEEAVEALRARVEIDRNTVFYLDCGNTRDITARRTVPVFERWQKYDNIAVIAFNADSTFGILEAAEQTSLLDRLAVVGHAADAAVLAELKQPDTRLVAATLYPPEDYGTPLVDLVMQLRNGQNPPRETLVDMKVVKAKRWQKVN